MAFDLKEPWATHRKYQIYVIRLILETDKLAEQIFTNPKIFVRASADRERFRRCIGTFVDDLIIDVNAEVDGYAEDFDYRDKLRDADWIKKLAATIVADHLKQVSRGRIKSFQAEWESSA